MKRELRDYTDKRDFARSPEPAGTGLNASADAMERGFVVQKHAATRLHWDFRLEWQGVLLSWAVTRGPSADPGAKRLAVRTEDHPLDYAGFEGTIPKGEYGGGTVMLWDNGTWAPLEDVDAGLAAGKLKFVLSGTRMRGAWMLVRMKPQPREVRENWLLIKEHDAHATNAAEGLVRAHLTSVTTGRSMKDIAAGKAREPAKPGAVTKPKARKSAALPAFRPVQLAKLDTAPPTGDGWLHEIKFDGYRCLAALAGDRVRLFTRSGLDWTAQFGALVPAFEALPCRSALIDGEVIAADTPKAGFSELQSRLKHGGALLFMAFDLLEFDGRDLTPEPLAQRKAKLEKVLRQAHPAIRYSTHIDGHGPEIWAQVCAAGQEGIVSKLAAGPYRAGRHPSWRKVKCGQRQEFVIGGWSASTARDRPFASLLMGTFEGGRLVYRGRVGSGFGTREFAELMPFLQARSRKASPFTAIPDEVQGAHWLKPDLVAEVKFAELTAEGHIRHGVYHGLRQDKAGTEVRLEEPSTGAEDSMNTVGKGAKIKGITISHPDRKVFDAPGVTKLQVATHYATFADRILPFAADRPLSLLRCPDGVAGECFFQKHRGEGMPEAIGTVSVPGKRGEEEYISISTAAGLVGAVQMGAIELHIWGAAKDRLDKPDRLVFDLDPDEGLGFDKVRSAAIDLRALLDDLGLPSIPMLSGGKGIHVIVPLRPSAEWDTVKLLSQTVAVMMTDARPDRFIATMSKAKRKGLIFIDWLRNERGATAIAPYALRARPGAKVAVPLTWDELRNARSAQDFDIISVATRRDLPCPLLVATRKAVTLGPQVLKRLERLMT